MSNSIVITVPHRLGAKEAKRRIAEQIELLRRAAVPLSARWPVRIPIAPAAGFGDQAAHQPSRGNTFAAFASKWSHRP